MRWLTVILYIILLPLVAPAQDVKPADSSKTAKTDSSSADILLYPVTPVGYSSGAFFDQRVDFLSNGVFLGTFGVGVESMIKPENSSWFLSGFISTASAPGVRMNMMSGFTFGYYTVIDPSGSGVNRDDPHFYIRFGSGLSTTRVLHTQGLHHGSSERYIGFNALGIIGANLRMNDRSTLFTEAGLRGLWFPGSRELRNLGGPQFAIGFRFTFGGGIFPYRF